MAEQDGARSAPIVLVPGFWLGAWAWDEVARILRADGHRVTAITLPGLESPEADRSKISFQDHVDAIVRAIEAADVPVVLTLHSATGFSGYAATDRVPERIAAVVYVDTAPGKGALDPDFAGDEKPMVWDEIEAEENLTGLSEEQKETFRQRAVPADDQQRIPPQRWRGDLDPFVGLQPHRHRHFPCPAVLHHEHLAHPRELHQRRQGRGEGGRFDAGEDRRLGKAAGLQRPVRVGDLDLHLEGPRVGIDGRINAGDDSRAWLSRGRDDMGLLIQLDLADTLQAIARDGPSAFYHGRIAERIAGAVMKAGGIMTKDDLAGYSAVERPVVRGTYRGYEIVTAPPPSSGGVHLVEMLNILEGYDLAGMSREQALHDMIEAMKRAYADRATFMGDPDAVKIPLKGLLSKQYAASLRSGIGESATPSATIRAGNPADFEGRNTTHFSIVDRDGNAVSNTYTLNFSYGLGLVAEGTGVLLNNELDDFTSKPGSANAYGLVGYNANLPAPGKRPLSSMTPTIVLKDGKPFLITGSPGGSRIITAVLQVIVDVIDFGMPINDAVSTPRLHHQWQPDEVYVEPGFAPDLLDALRRRGHNIVPVRPFTSVNSIEVGGEGYVGAADRRTRGSLAAGY